MTTLDEAVTTAREPASPGARLRSRQAERMSLYRKEPAHAWTIDSARTTGRGRDAEHNEVEVAKGFGVSVPLGVHHNLGGMHDLPTPGDMLCAALAACADSSIRLIANHLGVVLEELSVGVTGEVDVRGTMCVSPDVPIGFQKMRVAVHIRAKDGTDPHLVDKLLAAADYCCVVLQTLRSGVPVEWQRADD